MVNQQQLEALKTARIAAVIKMWSAPRDEWDAIMSPVLKLLRSADKATQVAFQQWATKTPIDKRPNGRPWPAE